MSKPSFLQRLKNRLTLRKNVTDTPDRVSEIASELAGKIADETDLRAIQRRLLARQLQVKRNRGIEHELNRDMLADFRARIRQPLASALVREVFITQPGSRRLYLSLSNGMRVRADKPHRSLHLRGLIHARLTADAKAAGLNISETVETLNAV